ncbi:MAG: hypothetical protein LWX07_13295 [Bacteroidetes bacterium]|nr:hypothetical protein [Bacteroidota bacterium]
MNVIKIFTAALLVLIISVTGVYAQKDTSDRKLNKVIREKLVEKLGIDESTADKVISLHVKHRQDMKEIKKQQEDYMKDILDNPDSPDIQTKLETLIDLDNKIYLKKKEFYENLKSYLTPNQIAQSMSFIRDVSKFMKKEMKDKHHHKEDNR